MGKRRLQQLILGTAAVIGLTTTAHANCRQVNELLAQGFSIGDVAAALGAPVGAVQACLQPGAFVVPSGPVTSNPAGPPPLGAAGPPPLGAAGPPPLGAAGPAPRGAAGPPPLGAPGPPPLGAPGGSTIVRTR